jgi:hypothetical protein
MAVWKTGQIGKNTRCNFTLNGSLLSVPKVRSRCGYDFDTGAFADREMGAQLTQWLKEFEEIAEQDERQEKLDEKGRRNEISLDGYDAEQLKLFGKWDAEMRGRREATKTADISCPKCLEFLGKLSVTLTPVSDTPSGGLSMDELIKMKASPEMTAYLSKRMRFGSVAQLENWLDDSDMRKAQKVLEKAIVGLDELALDDKTSYLKGDLQRQIGEIDAESRRRRVEFVRAVETAVKERVFVYGQGGGFIVETTEGEGGRPKAPAWMTANAPKKEAKEG